MTESEALNDFGKILISDVRDPAIDTFLRIANKQARAPAEIDLQKMLEVFDDKQMEAVRKIVFCSIDDMLHNFLWMIEQHEENIELNYNGDDGQKMSNLRDISDGLSGELYSEDGWIARFSEYEESYGI